MACLFGYDIFVSIPITLSVVSFFRRDDIQSQMTSESIETHTHTYTYTDEIAGKSSGLVFSMIAGRFRFVNLF